jgi:hypothetical protein
VRDGRGLPDRIQCLLPVELFCTATATATAAATAAAAAVRCASSGDGVGGGGSGSGDSAAVTLTFLCRTFAGLASITTCIAPIENGTFRGFRALAYAVCAKVLLRHILISLDRVL